jgi:hypothetical protein
MDLVKTAELDFVTPLCIDNSVVREKVMKSSYRIESVPCLLVTYASGSIEKFEGSAAGLWIESLMEKIRPPPAAPRAPERRVTIDPQVIEQEEELPPPPPRKRAPQQQQRNGATSIDSLMDLDDDDEMEDDRPSQNRNDPLNGLAPRIANPKGRSSAADIIDDADIDPNLMDEKVKKAVKGSEGNSILAQAQAMQKQRDKESEKMRLPVKQ